MISSEVKYICDTNIWVKAVIGNVIDSFVETYNRLCFADGVENEIRKWSVNEGKYKNICTEFECRKENNFDVIYLEKLDIMTQQLIKTQLRTYGFHKMDNSRETIKNLGEYLSLLYSYHLEIPFLQTDDVEFYGNAKLTEAFSGIAIITWNDIASKITSSDTERIRLNTLIEREQKKMNEEKMRANSLEAKIEKLMRKHNSR